MTLGQRIRQLRKEQHLTQRQLAQLVDADFSYLSKIENGRLEHTPSLKMLQDLAHALKTDELELMELADKVPSVFAPLTGNSEAMRFFRRAAQTLTTSEQWRELNEVLDRRENE